MWNCNVPAVDWAYRVEPTHTTRKAEIPMTRQPLIAKRTAIVLLAALAANLHAEPAHWRGDFVYFADAALFTDCASGKRWPVAMTADAVALQRSYLEWRKEPAAPLLVNFDGRLDVREAMEGPAREQMVVERFRSVEPGNTCAVIAAVKGNKAP